ncbi:MAG: methylase involved in ubiquinone/menaquinone biosynthesis [Halonotius sp. J07HN4]|nr:MAG: methylase involved in ubiquinone/menaquinone biosynthesis [Halonotius sp. J07HN4]
MAVLSKRDRRQIDSGDDGSFYDAPRYVTHASDTFLNRVTDLYDRVLTPGDRVFDAMGSWVSHLPDTELAHVVGHGLNTEELAANDRYDEWFVQNFNDEQSLPLADDSFEMVCCALSVQYLQYPAAIFSEFERVLTDDGVVVISFTDRMFPTKAVQAWRLASMTDRAELVGSYIRAGGMTVRDRIEKDDAESPFYAVVGSCDQ